MATNDTQEPVLLPEGIADPAGGTGFFATGAAAIEAIGLAEGSLLWHTEAAERPLLLSGHLLAAQASVPGRPNALRIVLLDVSKNGEPVLTSEPVVLPEWVDACARAPEAFRTRARLEARGLILDWEAHDRYAGGAPPSRQVSRQAARDAAGAVRIDLDTGRAETVASERSGASPGAATLREADSPPSSPDVVWQTEPWSAGTGDRLAALAMKQESPDLSLSLETWGGGASRATPKRFELARGAGMAPSLSLDGKYVLVEPDEPALPAGSLRTWWVFETATGRRIATIPHEEGAREPSVVGSRLFYLLQDPQRPAPGQEMRTILKARDLHSGELLWERSLSSPLTARAPELPR